MKYRILASWFPKGQCAQQSRSTSFTMDSRNARISLGLSSAACEHPSDFFDGLADSQH